MKKILVIGAGYLQSFAIRRAKDLGYYVLAIDGNPNAMGFQYADEYETIDIIDEENCLQYAKVQKIDGVITAATDFSVLTVSRIAMELGLPGVNYEAVKTVKNKYLVRKRLFETKADDTGQAFEVNSLSDIDLIEDKIKFPVMIKPCDGSGSRGTSKACSIKELRLACIEAIKNSNSKKALIESFIVGSEYGVESFVYNGEIHVMGVMKKWMTQPPYYAELGHAFPSNLSKVLEEKVEDVVKKAIKALDIDYGPVNMDVLITDNGSVHVVDVGVRMGGNLIYTHLIPLGTGVDYLGNVIKAAVGDDISFCVGIKTSVATALLALKPGRIFSYPDIKSFQNKWNLQYVSFLKKEGDTISLYRTNIDGCGYIVATGENMELCHNKAFEAKEYFDEELVRF